MAKISARGARPLVYAETLLINGVVHQFVLCSDGRVLSKSKLTIGSARWSNYHLRDRFPKQLIPETKAEQFEMLSNYARSLYRIDSIRSVTQI